MPFKFKWVYAQIATRQHFHGLSVNGRGSWFDPENVQQQTRTPVCTAAPIATLYQRRVTASNRAHLNRAPQLKPQKQGWTPDWEGVTTFKTRGGQFENRGYRMEGIYSGCGKDYGFRDDRTHRQVQEIGQAAEQRATVFQSSCIISIREQTASWLGYLVLEIKSTCTSACGQCLTPRTCPPPFRWTRWNESYSNLTSKVAFSAFMRDVYRNVKIP